VHPHEDREPLLEVSFFFGAGEELGRAHMVHLVNLFLDLFEILISSLVFLPKKFSTRLWLLELLVGVVFKEEFRIEQIHECLVDVILHFPNPAASERDPIL